MMEYSSSSTHLSWSVACPILFRALFLLVSECYSLEQGSPDYDRYCFTTLGDKNYTQELMDAAIYKRGAIMFAS